MDIKSLGKPIWNNCLGVKLCSLSLHKKEFGEIQAEIRHIRDYNYATNIFAQNGARLGKDYFAIYPEEKRMFDFNIETSKNYRGKFRIGELMRLISIMEMIENKIKTMQLYSRESAVLFHAKYGFQSDIRQFSHRDNTLNAISKDTRFKDLAQKAKLLVKQLQECLTGAENRELCRLTSKLADEYINRVKSVSAKENPKFNQGFDMILHRETVLSQREKFNELFKRHGIDYKI